MRFTSPHPALHLPPEQEANLPRFLLEAAKTSERAQQPILFPPSHQSVFAARPQAKPLSLRAIADLAYGIAYGLLQGKLGSRPFEKGDVIAVYSPNQHDYVPIVLGIQLAGGITALCNPSYKPKELAHQLRMTGASAVLTASCAGLQKTGQEGREADEDTPFSRAQKAAILAYEEDDDASSGQIKKLARRPDVFVFEEDHPNSIHNILANGAVGDNVRAEVEKRSKTVSGQDAAVYCFSSGTSGLPKAVILTHANLVANTVQASFLLYDRMNVPVETGVQYSPDGKTGWYDKAERKGVGRELRPAKTVGAKSGEQESASKPKSGKLSIGKLAGRLKRGLGTGSGTRGEVAEKDKEQKAEPCVEAKGYEGGSGFERIESRPKGEQEFHIDVLPQFHCYGLVVNLVAIHTATPRMILPRFHLETYLASIQEHGITFGFVVPPILLALAKHPLVDKYDISTLWRVASGAASLPDEIIHAVGARLSILCTDGYGMTEMSPIVALQTPLDVKRAPKTVGLMAPNTEAMVCDPEGKELGVDEPGELLLRGPQMMRGYLHNDEANQKAFCTIGDEKWLRTGDVVKIDSRGYITITDRLKDVIKAKGFQVSPAELESLLFKDDRVQDAAVVGTTDPADGSERPWAFVVSRDPLSEDSKKNDEKAQSILERVNRQVAGYKKIAGLTWLDALPKSEAGKVLKRNLVAL